MVIATLVLEMTSNDVIKQERIQGFCSGVLRLAEGPGAKLPENSLGAMSGQNSMTLLVKIQPAAKSNLNCSCQFWTNQA